MSENKNNFISYQPIDETGTAEDNFYEILTEKIKVFSTKHYLSENAKLRYKTIFLNGRWGSGKSQFIKNVETNTNKSHLKKFIYLDLWRIKDNRTALSIAFGKLHPIIYWISKGIGILAVALSLMLTPILDIDFLALLKNNLLAKTIIGGIILALGIWQFMKYKSDDFYHFLFNKKCKLLSLENKILVIDDFDRVSQAKQYEAYKLFDVIQGKLPILFVGDYDKIFKSDNDNYLSKIIDRRIELPEVLQSHHVFNNIWNQFKTKFVGRDINTPYFSFSKDGEQVEQFILGENRSLREIHQFTDMLNHEFINKGKLYTVQPYQQFLIIYIYMFYPNLYRQISQISELELSKTLSYLKSKELFEVDTESDRSFPIQLLGRTDKEKQMIELLSQELIHDDDTIYPPTFLNQKNDYLINEEVSNLSVAEAARILNDEKDLKKIIHDTSSPMAIDFKRYLQSEYARLSKYWDTEDNSFVNQKFLKDKRILEKLVFSEINNEHTKNSIVDLVVKKLQYAIYYEAQKLMYSYTGISTQNQEVIQDVEKRTGMELSSDKPTIEILQYMLWNQFLTNFDDQNKKYFFETYYEVVDNNQLTNKISKYNWLFIEKNGFICNKLNLEFKDQK